MRPLQPHLISLIVLVVVNNKQISVKQVRQVCWAVGKVQVAGAKIFYLILALSITLILDLILKI